MPKIRLRRPAALLLFCLAFATHARDPILFGDPWLQADFDDHPTGVIGTGGAALGEPAALTPDLDASVIAADDFPTPSLQLTYTGDAPAADARFDFLDDEVATDGVLYLRFDVAMPHNLLIVGARGADVAEAVVGDLAFTPLGRIVYRYDGDEIDIGPYEYGTPTRIAMSYSFNDESVEVEIDGRLAYRRAVPMPAGGLRSLLFRRPSAAGTSPATIDNLDVSHLASARTLLEASFDIDALGPIATGGAALGQPVTIDLPVVADVIAADAFPSRALRIARSDIGSSATGYARFEFLDGAAVSEGAVVIALRLYIPAATRTYIDLREAGGAAYSYGSLYFIDGAVVFSAGGAPLQVVGTVDSGHVIDVQLEYDLDAGLVTLDVDGETLHGPAPIGIVYPAGLGAMSIGQPPDSSGPIQIDDIDVMQFSTVFPPRPPGIFADGLEDAPI